MVEWTLYVGSALGFVVALLYGWLGAHHARRAYATGLAPAMFALFWWGIALHAALESTWALAVALGEPSLAIGVTVLLLKILTGVAAVAGLVLYLLIVYGMPERWAAFGAVYVGLYALMVYDYLSRVPVAHEARVWYAGLRYQHPVGVLHVVVALLLFVPPFLAAIAYLLLLRYTREPATRRRILATSTSLAVFFAGFLLGWANEHWYWWGLVERLLPIAAGVAVLWTLPRETRRTTHLNTPRLS